MQMEKESKSSSTLPEREADCHVKKMRSKSN
jgi:hypothetical protein